MLIVSMMVPPHSGDIPVGAFCVEEGRWSGRGEEDVAEFSASTERVPSKAARVALAKRVQRELVPEAGGVASQPQQQPRSGASMPNRRIRILCGSLCDGIGMPSSGRTWA